MFDQTTKDIFFLVGFLFQIGGVITAGVWVISRIKGTTELLNASICGLRETIGELKTWVKHLDDKAECTKDRLTRLEVKMDSYHAKDH